MGREGRKGAKGKEWKGREGREGREKGRGAFRRCSIGSARSWNALDALIGALLSRFADVLQTGREACQSGFSRLLSERGEGGSATPVRLNCTERGCG